jgi:hypothetical protein
MLRTILKYIIWYFEAGTCLKHPQIVLYLVMKRVCVCVCVCVCVYVFVRARARACVPAQMYNEQKTRNYHPYIETDLWDNE